MKNILSIGLLVILLTGCGAEIAYKRGATARDLQVGKKACLKAGNEADLEKCMEENGWMVQKLDGSGFSDDDLFATASVAKDNRMTAPTEKTIRTTTDIPEAVNEEQESVSIDDKVKPQKAKQTVTAKAAPSSKTRAQPSSEKATATKPKHNMMDTYVIKSWWKMGGNLTLLESHMDECRAVLGKAHYPNKKTFTFTRGFAICMRQHGWRGLVEKRS